MITIGECFVCDSELKQLSPTVYECKKCNTIIELVYYSYCSNPDGGEATARWNIKERE